MRKSMLGSSSSGDELVSQSTHLYTLWVGNTSISDFNHDASPSHFIQITTFLAFIPIPYEVSSTGTPTVVITDAKISGSQDTCMLPVLPCLVGLPINLIDGIFITGTGLSASIFSFVNRTTDRWSAIYFIITECAANDTSFDSLSTSLSLHDYVDLLYRENISHSHIILFGRCHITNWYRNHITNWYRNNSACYLCTMCGTLASDQKNFCSPLQYDSTVNSNAHK